MMINKRGLSSHVTVMRSDINPQDFDPFALDYNVNCTGHQAKEWSLKNFRARVIPTPNCTFGSIAPWLIISSFLYVCLDDYDHYKYLYSSIIL